MIKYMITLVTITSISISTYATGLDSGIERNRDKPFASRFLTKRGINYHKLHKRNFFAMRRHHKKGGCNGAH